MSFPFTSQDTSNEPNSVEHKYLRHSQILYLSHKLPDVLFDTITEAVKASYWLQNPEDIAPLKHRNN